MTTAKKPSGLVVLISGASGLIGRALVAALRGEGHEVRTLVRKKPSAPEEFHWDPVAGSIDREALDSVDAVVNLSGASLSRIPWTASHKRAILSSRIDTTRTLAEAITQSSPAPRVLIQASAVGFYGDRGEQELVEASPAGEGYLAHVTTAWEQGAQAVLDTSTRVVFARTGLVIARGGAMAPLRLQILLGVGGPIGSGQQWWPWVSLHDEVRALMFLIHTDSIQGPVNIAGPTPARSVEVTRSLARALRRPHWLGLPRFAVSALLGEAGRELLLPSQKVIPAALTEAGFEFVDRDISAAIERIV